MSAWTASSSTPTTACATHRAGSDPGWRRLHNGSEQQLDNAHLMRMAGRVSRRVRAFAKARGIPVIDCGRGDRKHQIAEEYLAAHPVSRGVFLILVARAAATVWEVQRSARGVVRSYAEWCDVLIAAELFSRL